MKQNLSQYFELRSARLTDQLQSKLIVPTEDSTSQIFKDRRQLLSAVSEKILAPNLSNKLSNVQEPSQYKSRQTNDAQGLQKQTSDQFQNQNYPQRNFNFQISSPTSNIDVKRNLEFNDPRSAGQDSIMYINGDFDSEDPRTNLMLSDSNQNTIAKLSNNNNTDLQQLNNFLTSDGESERNMQNYNQLGYAMSADYRSQEDNNGQSSANLNQLKHNQMLQYTNQTTSSLQNVPMSYSSTNSRGYLNNRFQKLNDLASPNQNADSRFQSERQPRFSDQNTQLQSSNKKSVKFLDEQNDSYLNSKHKTTILNTSNLISNPDNEGFYRYQGQKANQDEDIDKSQIIQDRIESKMNELNNKYFSNEEIKQNLNSSSVERKLKPIIKQIENVNTQKLEKYKPLRTYIETLNPLSDTKQNFNQLSPCENTQTNLKMEGQQDEDSDTNSIVAMEEEIENQKRKVNDKIDNQYFSNRTSAEPSIVIKNKLDLRPSVYTSTNSIERLRDELLNNQSYAKLNDSNNYGTATQNRSLLMAIKDEFPNKENGASATKEFTLNTGFNFDRSVEGTQAFGQDTQNLIRNYIPLRKSRERSEHSNEKQNFSRNQESIPNHCSSQSRERNYQHQFMNQNQQFENKLQHLKQKINQINQQNNQSYTENNHSTIISRQQVNEDTLHNIITTPKVRDLNSIEYQSSLGNNLQSFENRQQQQNTGYNNHDTNSNLQEQYSKEILILQPMEYQTGNSSRGQSSHEGGSQYNNSSSRERNQNLTIPDSNMNTRDLRSKIMDLKNSITDNDIINIESIDYNRQGHQQQNRRLKLNINSSRAGSIASNSSIQTNTINIDDQNNIELFSRNQAGLTHKTNQKSASLRNRSSSRQGSGRGNNTNSTYTFANHTQSSRKKSNITHDTINSSQQNTSVQIIRPSYSKYSGQKDKESQHQQSVDEMKKKIKWLEKRNMEYSQRLKDLNCEKNSAQIQITDLQRQLREMSQRLNFQHNNLKQNQNFENTRIEQLQQQVIELQTMMQGHQQNNTTIASTAVPVDPSLSIINKENTNPNHDSFQNQKDNASYTNKPRLQSLKVNNVGFNGSSLITPKQVVPLRHPQHIQGTNAINLTAKKSASKQRSRSNSKSQAQLSKLKGVRRSSQSDSKQKYLDLPIQTPLNIKSSVKIPQAINTDINLTTQKAKPKSSSKSKSKSKERKKIGNTKKHKLIIHSLSKQVCELQSMIKQIKQQQQDLEANPQTKQQLQSVQKDQTINQNTDQYGIIEVILEKLMKFEGNQEKIESFKKSIQSLVTDNEGLEGNRPLNPFIENSKKYKRDKSN
eukprot:403369424